jgi:hypothetical protein
LKVTELIMLLYGSLAVSAIAQTGNLGVKVALHGSMVEGIYSPHARHLCDDAAQHLVGLLKKRRSFTAWALTAGDAAETMVFTFDQKSDSRVCVMAALQNGKSVLNSWDTDRCIGRGQAAGRESMPPPGPSAPAEVARLIDETIIDDKQDLIMREGLSQIPFSARPPQRSKSYSRSVVLPIPADDAVAKALSSAEFRVVCKYAAPGDMELYAIAKPSRKESYNGGIRATYTAMVAVGRTVDDGSGEKDLEKWAGDFDKLKPMTFYIRKLGSSDVRLSIR